MRSLESSNSQFLTSSDIHQEGTNLILEAQFKFHVELSKQVPDFSYFSPLFPTTPPWHSRLILKDMIRTQPTPVKATRTDLPIASIQQLMRYLVHQWVVPVPERPDVVSQYSQDGEQRFGVAKLGWETIGNIAATLAAAQASWAGGSSLPTLAQAAGTLRGTLSGTPPSAAVAAVLYFCSDLGGVKVTPQRLAGWMRGLLDGSEPVPSSLYAEGLKLDLWTVLSASTASWFANPPVDHVGGEFHSGEVQLADVRDYLTQLTLPTRLVQRMQRERGYSGMELFPEDMVRALLAPKSCESPPHTCGCWTDPHSVGGWETGVRWVDRRALPWRFHDRLFVLFDMQASWRLSELVAYMSDVVVNLGEAEQVVLNNTRVTGVTADQSRVVCVRPEKRVLSKKPHK
eukprot:gnl/Dysnectes_brevis/2585_a3116_410.p1 GENE.gnl/Dysnectes_brevis/2585_a3116_410~~gnl/Dysnectes_brevis/2585_a3116_410.p1  ORF type:complete len:467 (-),score=144.84 gnl/Dysnectes_brevis/2585_a3116_410:632-1831(-)